MSSLPVVRSWRTRVAALLAVVFVGTALSACNPNTWLISGNVTHNATATIDSGKTLLFDPNASSTLTIDGNLIIKGTLTMRPAHAGIEHRIVFTGANEAGFAGGGMDVLDSDRGLWVMEAGRLDIAGTERTPWARLAGPVSSGATTITVDRDLTGWQAGDQLRISPTGSQQYTQFDEVTVQSVSARQVTFTTGLAFAHPQVALPDGTSAQAEVLNITRNVRIEGTQPAVPLPRAAGANPSGRSHIFIRNTSAVVHDIDYVALRYMGPRKFDPGTGRSVFVLGRYALHFHMSNDNNRGTEVRGAVVTDSGSAAYVAHTSHGITFDRTISYDTVESPYWWDVKSNEEPEFGRDPTDDTLYNETVAAKVISDRTGGAKNRLTGFSLGCGERNTVTGAVAVGVGDGIQASGFLWPEGAGGCFWDFTDNVAHNNKKNGIFTWQNDDVPHAVSDFVAYRNGGSGIEHGAYRNRFDYERVVLAENDAEPGGINDGGGGIGEFVLHAVARPPGIDVDDARLAVLPRAGARALYVLAARQPPYDTTHLRSWVVDGPTGPVVTIDERLTIGIGQEVDIPCWTVNGGELDPSDFEILHMDPASVYQVQRRDGTAYRLTRNPDGSPNGQTITPFATCP